jgi:hypothetical protein
LATTPIAAPCLAPPTASPASTPSPLPTFPPQATATAPATTGECDCHLIFCHPGPTQELPNPCSEDNWIAAAQRWGTTMINWRDCTWRGTNCRGAEGGGPPTSCWGNVCTWTRRIEQSWCRDAVSQVVHEGPTLAYSQLQAGGLFCEEIPGSVSGPPQSWWQGTPY